MTKHTMNITYMNIGEHISLKDLTIDYDVPEEDHHHPCRATL